ncbi:hypothetical protein ES708_23416 [subsurface metagenome]
MNPIELGKAIAEHGIPIITAVMLILVVGLVWYLIKRQSKREEKFDIERAAREERHDKQQDEDRKFNRNIITNELKGLHETSLKNTELNIQGIALQKEIMKDFKDHNGHAEKFSKEIIKSINLVCDKLNSNKESK